MVIWEVSEPDPRRAPTPEEQAAADALVSRCREAAERLGWFSFEQGLADGYRKQRGDPRHYVNEERLFDNAVLDCERPEFLMYYETPQGPLLAGLMFYAQGPDLRGPQIGGPLTLWHYHIWKRAKCFRDGLMLTGAVSDAGSCSDGEPSHRSPEMLHVWFVERPDGPFTTAMGIPRGELEAALGVGASPTEP